jgi:hypothetical protein
MTYNPDPAAPENNLHHTMTYRSEQDWWDDEFGTGPFDPTFLGYYPGEDETNDAD